MKICIFIVCIYLPNIFEIKGSIMYSLAGIINSNQLITLNVFYLFILTMTNKTSICMLLLNNKYITTKILYQVFRNMNILMFSNATAIILHLS